jgi:hypothetical protein
MTMNQNVRTGTPTQLVDRVVHQAIRSMARWFEQKTGHIFFPNVRVDFSPKRRASRGGIRRDEAFVTMAVAKVTEALRNNKLYTHHEYAHYKNDRTIGEFTGPWDKCVYADCAHEITHAIVWAFGDSPRIRQAFKISAAYETSHGDYFQALYRAFREQFVNNASFDIPTIVLEEEVKVNPRAPKPVEKKRSVKGIKMVLSKSSNGWFIHKYYDEAGELLGTMASKPRCASQGLVDGVWVVLKDKNNNFFKNHNEAKKHFLKL